MIVFGFNSSAKVRDRCEGIYKELYMVELSLGLTSTCKLLNLSTKMPQSITP